MRLEVKRVDFPLQLLVSSLSIAHLRCKEEETVRTPVKIKFCVWVQKLHAFRFCSGSGGVDLAGLSNADFFRLGALKNWLNPKGSHPFRVIQQIHLKPWQGKSEWEGRSWPSVSSFSGFQSLLNLDYAY